MTESITMTPGLHCVVEGQLSAGAVLTFVILMLQICFGLIMRRRANFPGRRFFLIANIALAYWLLLATLEQWTTAPGCKIWFAALTHFGISLVPLSLVMFVHRYCYGIRGPMRGWQKAVLVLVPLTVVTIALTSPLHGLFYGPGTGPISDLPGAPVVYAHGPLFALSATVLYVALAWSVYLLALGAIASRPSYRLHFWLLLLMTLAPVAANMAYIIADAAIFDFDPTPFFFIFTSMAYAVIIMTNNHLDLVGVARKDFFDEFPTALAVIDTSGRMQSVNRAGVDLMSLPDLPRQLQTLIRSATPHGSPPVEGHAITLDDRALRVSLHPILSPLGHENRIIGWMTTVEDVTAWQNMVAGLTATLEERSTELERTREATQQLQSLAVRDPLTGALNRRGLENALKSLLSDGTPPAAISIALIDIDHFKQINDTYGHEAGDAVLVRFADILMRTFRRSDLVFRVGGEEFLVLGPQLDLETMSQRLDHARKLLAADPQVQGAVPDGSVRFSAGLDRWTKTGDRPMTEVMRSVDTLLYAAKRDGRDRTTTPATADGVSQPPR